MRLTLDEAIAYAASEEARANVSLGLHIDATKLRGGEHCPGHHELFMARHELILAKCRWVEARVRLAALEGESEVDV